MKLRNQPYAPKWEQEEKNNTRGVMKQREKPLTFYEYITEYFRMSSIPGVRHLVHPKRHPLETILWLALLVFAVTLSASVIMTNWERYSANPILVSLEKDYRNWEFEFPAMTLCHDDRVNESKAEEYIENVWGVRNDSKAEYYMKFIRTVVNMSYSNLQDFKQFGGDVTLMNIDLEDLINQVYNEGTVKLSADNRGYKFTKTMTATELGFCVTFGSLLQTEFVPSTNTTEVIQPKMCSYILRVCAVWFHLTEKARIAIHSVHEVPDSSNRPYESKFGMTYSLAVRNMLTVSSPEVRQLPIHRRGCQYLHETEGFGIPVYTYKLCRMKCRRKLAIKMCGCSPPLYQQLGKLRSHKTCGVKGLICLGDNIRHLLKLLDMQNKTVPCACLPMCESASFQIVEEKFEDLKMTKINRKEQTALVNIYIGEYAKVRFRRDVLFTFDDLLVSLGSTAGFFVGCSLLSVVETVYYFTLRLMWYFWRRRQFILAPEPRRTRLAVFNEHQ